MPIPLPPPPARTSRARPVDAPDLLCATLRERVLNGLHMGLLMPGDRLPSIRQTAREMDADHRQVAQAYRTLQAEGLVEVRGRSGVCVAESALAGADEPGDTGRWLAGVLAEAWQRNVSAERLRSLVAACAASGLRCACVESNLDQMVAYATEIRALAGLDVEPVYLDPGAQELIPEGAERRRIAAQLAGVELVITTHYHAAAVRSVIGEQRAMVLVRIHPTLADAVRRQIRAGGITVVAATEAFGARLRLMYADVLSDPGRLRLVLADDRAALRALDPREPVLLTRAARERGAELAAPRLAFPHSPTLSPETIQELSEVVVRLRLAAVPRLTA